MIIFIGASSKENEVTRHQQYDGTCFLPFLRIPILPLHNSKDSKEISEVLGLLEMEIMFSKGMLKKQSKSNKESSES